jgi:hypothetical protein
VEVPPQASLGPINKDLAVSPGEVLMIEVPVVTTKNVPVGTVVSVELNEWGSSRVRPLYQVVDGRTRSVTINSPGNVVTVTFQLLINGSQESDEPPWIANWIRIYKVSPNSVVGIAPPPDAKDYVKFTVRSKR